MEEAKAADRLGLGCVFVRHPSGRFDDAVLAASRRHPELEVRPPLARDRFLRLLATARLVVTDSGGTQEECMLLRTPVLVARARSERPVVDPRVALVDPSDEVGFARGLHDLVERTANTGGPAVVRREPSAADAVLRAIARTA